MTIEKLVDNFGLFGDWTERYGYIIDLGKKLPPMEDGLKTEETKVRGCQSQVWMVLNTEGEMRGLSVVADSDAHIVRGLIAVLMILYSGKSPAQILSIDAREVFRQLGLDQHLSPNRTNGVFSMVDRIRNFAHHAG